tara:strand:+ start:31 stop:1395 length:1365 start_codon:yes stop_codon:yes gene_type:complete
MSKIEVNEIVKSSGSTLTIGGCGTAVTLGSGATQTGFGRTGTVDWQTGSIKTSTFTAVNGQGFFADTSSGAFTMNLPAGTAGNIVSVVDYTNTFGSNSLTISPNGSQKIGGVANGVELITAGQSVTFVYVDDTEGWKNVQDSTSNVTGNEFIEATGGTITTCGNDRVHTFTSPGTFTVSNLAIAPANNVVSYVVVGGGGGGTGAGAGAGGFREGKSPVTPYTSSPLVAPTGLTVTATGFPISIGAGGAGANPGYPGSGAANGSDSTFSTITSAGGGRAGNSPVAPPSGDGQAGGSGGGAGNHSGGSAGAGAGNTPPVSPPQGNNGGTSSPGPGNAVGMAGGGGATAVGGNGTQGPSPTKGNAGAGGAGATSEINFAPVARAGGGGGGAQGASPQNTGNLANGGTGGGGSGSIGIAATNANGTVNTGGGGGGIYSSPGDAGTGGSGIVIIRYKIQ